MDANLFEESQKDGDTVPSQNRAPVTCQWDSAPVMLSEGDASTNALSS